MGTIAHSYNRLAKDGKIDEMLELLEEQVKLNIDYAVSAMIAEGITSEEKRAHATEMAAKFFAELKDFLV